MSSASVANAVRPRHRVEPQATSNAAQEAIELAASAGLVLDPWQEDVLRAALGEQDKKWAAFEVGLVVPRQNGKGSILEARELAGLFLFGDELILHSAHEFKTAAEAYRRIRKLIEQTPDLDRQVLKMLSSNSYTGIELRNGARLSFVARSSGSGRGFSGDLIVLDEAYNLAAESVDAMIPTLSARRNPQVWYTSSAPIDGDSKSEVLRSVCRRGRAGAGPRQAYIEFCAAHHDEPLDLDDDEALARANPSLGLRVSVDFIREVERPTLTDEGFARERFGIWNSDAAGGWSVIGKARWGACSTLKTSLGGPPSFSLDVSPDQSRVSFGVAGESSFSGVHVELISTGAHPGDKALVREAKRLQDEHGGVLAVVQGSPAADHIKDLEAAGVDLFVLPFSDYVQACGSFFTAVTQDDPSTWHRGQRELDAAVKAAERKWTGDAWYWVRRSAVEDVTGLVAVTIARWAHLHAEHVELSVW